MLIHHVECLKIVLTASTKSILVDLLIRLYIVIMLELRQMPLQPLLLQTDLRIIIEWEVNRPLELFSTYAVIFDVLHKLANSLRGLGLFFEKALQRSAIVLIEQISNWPSFLQHECSGFLLFCL